MTQPHYIDRRQAPGFFERYGDKIEYGAPSGCWLGTGTVTVRGYGQISVGGKNRRAHRAAFEAENGPIPAGLMVRHKCDTPPCVNPDHLLVGTNDDNVRDREERGRTPWGRDCRWTKISAETVRTVRETYVPNHPEFSGAALARRFGVSFQLISAIINRKVWRRLP